jgi:hypothetical protein
LNNDNLALASFTNPFYKKFTKGIEGERKDLIQRASKCVEDYYLINVDKFKKPQSHAITEDDHINSKKLVTLSDDSDSENGELNIRLVKKKLKTILIYPNQIFGNKIKRNFQSFMIFFFSITLYPVQVLRRNEIFLTVENKFGIEEIELALKLSKQSCFFMKIMNHYNLEEVKSIKLEDKNF